MSNLMKRRRIHHQPLHLERARALPVNAFLPRWRLDGAWQALHSYVTLEGAAAVDGEDEDDVLARLEGGFEEIAILDLGRPDGLGCGC